MTAGTIRRLAVAACVAGIAGMIVSSALDRNGAALAFGLATATAVLCSMVATAVSAPRRAGSADQAARVEELVSRLVSAGAEEKDVRALVREASKLGP